MTRTEPGPSTSNMIRWDVPFTEAIAAAVFGLVEPGSEVLLFEPFYVSYSPVVARAGCRRVRRSCSETTPTRSPTWYAT